MYAAIKCIEDTLLIRRLQARELGFDKEADRHVAIMRDIASLERGLQMLKTSEANAQRPTPNAQCPMPAKKMAADAAITESLNR